MDGATGVISLVQVSPWVLGQDGRDPYPAAWEEV